MEEDKKEEIKEEKEVEETKVQEQKKEEVKEEIKKETKETVKQVKETIKKIDVKEDASQTKGFIKKFWQDPVQELATVAKDEKNKMLKITIILLAIWMVAVFISSLGTLYHGYTFGSFLQYIPSNLLRIIKAVISPLLQIAVLAGIICVLNSKNKKSFLTTAITVTIAKIPVVVAEVIGLLGLMGSEIYRITSPIAGLCSAVSMILVFISIKKLFAEEEDKKALIKFAIVMGIYCIVKFVISFLGIVM